MNKYRKMSEENLTTKYQKKTDKQHILDNPDTYIGSVECVDQEMFICENNKLEYKNINYVPGLYKLFDEGIVNCRDHVIRLQKAMHEKKDDIMPVTHISVSISDDGVITMINDGNGIDVAKHPEYDIWIPELIFGHLRTSTNYNKNEEKIVGGKNGFGFKLVLIWSSYGSIETIDHVRKLKYKQEFKNNLDEIKKPSITKSSVKPYTKIVFRPDYERFYGKQNLTDDMRKLFHKRVYDIGAVTPRHIKVKLDGNVVSVKSLQNYMDCFDLKESPKLIEQPNDRWEYGVCLTPHGEFTQVSFVNGIYTSKGGKHVDYILNQITKKLIAYIDKKKKMSVSANVIKEQLMVFINCTIVNPSFDSQTKDYMNTPVPKFGSSCVVSDKFIDKIAKMGVMEGACALAEVKDNKAAKKTDGTKSKNIKGIPKLIDANWAGTERSSECTIIFCEGDSAKAGIVSGLSKEDRDIIGVYPMKGKVLNVRGEVQKKIMENKEIVEIKKILGLEAGKKYDDKNIKKCLRYGKILFMTDQDLDGSHIKGLGINLFEQLWGSLSKIDGFIGFMNTPILKAKKGSNELLFYNDGEYEQWKSENDTKGWKIKYYKGLGTSTGKEFKEYFENKKIVEFKHEGVESSNAIDKVFNKKRSDDRKDWLSGYDRKSYLDTNTKSISYEDFIDKEMIHFSKYDCDRSIPNLMDGLKISLRKILYSAFKKNLTSEIKVAQFSGYVSENSGYHHGEASLNAAIVGLAQNYVGSNNVNLFEPNGQFGTRIQGGKDSASERYIFTQLNNITRSIFNAKDDAILKYLDDDGFPVEPIYYAPIVPMVLINGSKGIGTGFSTDILCYNMFDIIDYLQLKLNGNDINSYDFVPYYEGFKGTISKIESKKYVVKGCYEKIAPDTLLVTELPIGVWTEDFKEHLESLMENTTKSGKKVTPLVKSFNDMSKATNVNFEITLHKGQLLDLEEKVNEFGCNALEKMLKLYTTQSTSNMHMFDANEKLKKYDNVLDIINDYYETRLSMYDTRKQHIINVLEQELIILENKKNYINELLDDTLDLRRKKKEEINTILESKGYIRVKEDYNYLIKMTMDSVSEENVEKLMKDFIQKEGDLKKIKEQSIENMWLEELDVLEDEYKKYKISREKLMDEEIEKKKKAVKKSKKS